MSMCEAVSDRMPAVASGRSEWTAEEQAHLASCSGCAAEWTLVQAASRMGRDLAVDAATITPVVLKQVRAARMEEGRRRWMRQAVAVGSLAVAAVLLVVLMPEQREEDPYLPSMGVVVVEPADLQLAELDDAAPAELEMVLAEFEGPAVRVTSLDGPDVEELDQSQVEQALRSWEES